MTYHATDADRAAGTLPPATLSQIRDDLRTIGFAVVGNLVSAETREVLLASMLDDTAAVREAATMTPHEQRTGKGHLQLGPRRSALYVSADIVANPLIESVVATVLGDGAWLGFYNGNVNCPGSGAQPLHADRPYSWTTEAEALAAGEEWPPRTTTLSCSTALTDITIETGATEIYPGSHRETIVTTWEPGERPASHPDLLEKWGPPASMEIPAGGVCFRDPRMWHRGVPNPSDTPRPMLALTYHEAIAKHYRGVVLHDIDPEIRRQLDVDPTLRLLDSGELADGRLVFDESARQAFEVPSPHGIDRNVRFVSPPQRVNHFLDAHLVGGARLVDDGAELLVADP
ncbi:ectoine hydroxylase-related dioxygenase (phytanoyl-CoA dioxygenase family) [Ilumatobacter fluminis]|uniref:Ectoine hydroxylase-related dioxygenase (Phytanoyl-CoA dioxygenase family) n=1 Tax=Ilumatobacter fluminis TaxID=467091 RepID=A0A4R7HXL5_9ACTN|nr:phytanoyl-CoA dioxygenase family protein [Ilumatobacter fluminis]TDT14956.1 ectoine hydroxylase-related dioxygenase (phytanoyl-CoA dioxygenase family) [Ilumatobacter fluminis]